MEPRHGGDSIRRRVVVSGRVQGVWFRESCRKVAEGAGLAGFVRNLRDGRVEAAFEGPPEAVEHLVTWCRTGPAHARVTSVSVAVEDPVGEPGFLVL